MSFSARLPGQQASPGFFLSEFEINFDAVFWGDLAGELCFLSRVFLCAFSSTIWFT